MNRWDYYCYKKAVELFKRRILKKNIERYAGRSIISAKEGNRYIGRAIESEKPFVASRFGSTELSVILRREAYKHHRPYKNNDSNLCILSGFFPDNLELMDKFANDMLEMIGEIDLLCVWFSSLEEYIIGEYMPRTMLTRLTAVEPYAYSDPWSKNLKGKKVLVIHPFEESILQQYAKREVLFDNPDILPEFELRTIKAVQTIAGEKDDRFKTWFEALEYMKFEMQKVDFDIAIIGCGAYGMPLAIEAKRMGKQAVHMGGATQLLFGIMGARWDQNQAVNNMRNEHWVRPSVTEQCKNQQIVEGGCYW